jgi:ectoine hydroxylase-related dioxygenase (phytanoyl-CoA dioxygenase family)
MMKSRSPYTQGALFPKETRRCTALIGRSAAARQNWLVNPNLSRVMDHFLCKTTKNWYGHERHTYTTYPVLSISMTFDVRPGAKAQRLHRDDKNHHVDHTDRMKKGYKREDDVLMSVLIPGIETTVENGATLVIPGSHLWDDERAPNIEEVTYATMSPGEALLFLGSTYHAGGGNVTEDQNRTVHGLFFTRGTHRSEENQYLAHGKEDVLGWSREEQVRAGFGVSSPNLGFVNFVDPIKYLTGDYDPDVVEDLDPTPIVEIKA